MTITVNFNLSSPFCSLSQQPVTFWLQVRQIIEFLTYKPRLHGEVCPDMTHRHTLGF